jgi:hypothetical protein
MSTFSELSPLAVAAPEAALSVESLLPDGTSGTLVRANRQWSKRYLQAKPGFQRAPPPVAATSPGKAGGVRFNAQEQPKSPAGAGAAAGGEADGAAEGVVDEYDDCASCHALGLLDLRVV